MSMQNSSPAGAGAAPAGTAGASGTPQPSVLAAAGANDLSWMPQKFTTKKADGSFDLEASARKLVGSYGELEKRMVSGGLNAGVRPETPEAYALPETVKLPEGVTLETLRKDPQMAEWLNGAHAQGLTNEQLGHVMTGFFGFLERDGELAAKDATAQLRTTWASEADYQQHVGNAARAVNALAQKAGVDAAELDQLYGNEPAFIRLMAAIGAEMKEDVAPNTGGVPSGAGGFEERVAELAREIEALPQHDPKRTRLLEEYHGLFARRYPGKGRGASS